MALARSRDRARGRGARPPGGISSPTAIAGCTLWLDAAVGVTTSGGAVSSWTNGGSAGGTVGQGTSGFRPAHTAAGSLSRIAFDGVDDYLDGAVVSTFFGASARTVFVVANVTSIDTNVGTFNDDILLADQLQFLGLHLTQTGPVLRGYNYDGTVDYVTASCATGSIAIFEQRHDGVNLYSRVSAAAEASGASGALAGGGALVLGGRNSATNNLTGLLYGVAGYNVALSAADATLVYNYLATRYGLATR